MKALASIACLLLAACGVDSPEHEAPCSTPGEQRCVGTQAWVCEPSSAPCYDSETVDGNCPNAPDGGELHPELVDRQVWYENGSCEAGQ